MSTAPIISRLRSANPVPESSMLDDPDLFARIVALPPEAQRSLPAKWRYQGRTLAVAASTLVAAAALAAITLAVFPSSSQTSTGLSKFSTQGTPVSFSGTPPAEFGTPYVLAQLDGKAYFHVQQTALTAIDKTFANDPHLQHASFPRECYGDGTLSNGELTVLSLDCTPFPSPERPVLLPQIGMDLSHGATLLFIDGFAADGVARLELLRPDQQVVARAPVQNNVFHFEGITGREAKGALVAFDHDGHEVWTQTL